MGFGVPASVKLCPPGPVTVMLIAPAAQRLRHGCVRARAVQHNVRGHAARQCAVLVKMAHPAQVAFALFAHIAQHHQRRRQFHSGIESAHVQWPACPPRRPRYRMRPELPGARPPITGCSGVSAGNTVSRCAESRTTGPVLSGGRLRWPAGLPAHCRRRRFLPGSGRPRQNALPAIAPAPARHSSGAGIATSSTCQSMMVLGFACSQANAA